MKDVLTANLTDIFSKADDQGSHIGTRLRRMVDTSERVECPPFPRQLQIETSNICNHGCTFCAYTKMQRPKKHMDKALFRQLVKEAYDCGARDVGLFAGAEPLTCKWLEEYTAFCRDVGYEYIYITTNGTLGGRERFRRLLDAGLTSIKFSINGGNRETYKAVHGSDDWDRVIDNVKFVSEYRRTLHRPIYLGVSLVGMPDMPSSFRELTETIGPWVDEILYYEASNQSGQMDDLPLPPYSDCVLPFNKLHISREGYIKACCNDYENLLAIEDLNKMSLSDAWHSERFRALRRAHIKDRLDGTLCGKCIRGCADAANPINETLLSKDVSAGRRTNAA